MWNYKKKMLFILIWKWVFKNNNFIIRLRVCYKIEYYIFIKLFVENFSLWEIKIFYEVGIFMMCSDV